MVTLITPTTGHQRLKAAIRSVQQQSHSDFRHIVVIDGEPRRAAAEAIMAETNFQGQVMVLPEITGAGGFNGHLIYLTVPYLVKSEFVALLDEDNTLEPDHLSQLHALCERHRLDWAYSLRNVFVEGGESMRDDCQSLGLWPVYAGCYHHIDTSCYFVRREILKKATDVWDRPFQEGVRCPDQTFCGWLMHHYPRGFTSGEYSMNYSLGSEETLAMVGNHDRMDFFRRGNAIQAQIYRYFPWRYTEPADDIPYGNMGITCRDPELRLKMRAVLQAASAGARPSTAPIDS